MNDIEYLKETINRGSRALDGYSSYKHLVAVLLPKQLREPLEQLRQGPVWDGDLISKSARDALFGLGLAYRCWVKGEDGYNAATDFGGAISKEIGKITRGEIGA